MAKRGGEGIRGDCPNRSNVTIKTTYHEVVDGRGTVVATWAITEIILTQGATDISSLGNNLPSEGAPLASENSIFFDPEARIFIKKGDTTIEFSGAEVNEGIRATYAEGSGTYLINKEWKMENRKFGPGQIFTSPEDEQYYEFLGIASVILNRVGNSDFVGGGKNTITGVIYGKSQFEAVTDSTRNQKFLNSANLERLNPKEIADLNPHYA